MAGASSLVLNNKRPRFVFLLVLLLLLAIFTRPSSCSRHLHQPDLASGPGLDNVNGDDAANKAAAQTTTALPTAAAVSEVVPVSRRVEVLLDRKPRGRPAPSAPSKRTNDINS